MQVSIAEARRALGPLELELELQAVWSSGRAKSTLDPGAISNP